MASIRELVERYVEVYNEEGSAVYPLYADELEWIEVPGGGHGGRAELFEALGTYRVSHKLHMEILTITTEGSDAVLESYFTIAPLDSPDEPMAESHVLWFFGFDEAGLINVQRDYFIPKAASNE